MSTRSLAKTGVDYWKYVLRQYRKEHPGPFSDNRLLDWALENGYADLPKPNPRAILALASFDQRDANINRQKLAACRDVQSCLENNPNVAGHEMQFQFDFMSEESEVQVVEEIQESGAPTNPR